MSSKDTMDALLSRLSNMRAASFVDSTAKPALDKPALTVVVKFDDGKKEERVTFGQHGNDVYAVASRRAGAAKVDATDFNERSKRWTSSRSNRPRSSAAARLPREERCCSLQP